MNISVTFTPRQTKRLCLLTKKGEVIAMESEPKRVVFGYGKTGKQIDLFQRVLPGLVEAAKKQELRDQ
ncbi:MAG: hypothetical protein Q4Q04_05745 [Methanocorpusculum sp.]|nr:hypothetical protein [Methanocorpusculum sp.]